MIERRDLFNDDPNQRMRFICITTTPGSSQVAVAGRVCPGLVDFLAVAMERIARLSKVIYRKPEISLLTDT